MAKAKLKSALDQYRGRNIRLEKQRKKEKEARKRKEQNTPAEEVDGAEDEGGVSLIEETEIKANGKDKKGKKNGVKKSAAVVEQPEWETDESDEGEEGDSDEDGDEEDDDDMPERATIDMSKLDDSDSEGSSDEDEDAEDAEEEEDIALSDIESLASEDKGDIIPHQRLTINNTTALTAALNRISLPYSKLAFSEHQSITSDEPTEIPDVEDDLSRELAFYKQCLSAAKDARAKLKKEGVGFSRPADYFAEMVKSDEHMGKIKQKLVDEAAGKKAAAEARRQRDLKKFGKQVQVAKLQERAKDKRDTMEKINILKRSTLTHTAHEQSCKLTRAPERQGADVTATNEEDLFDVELDSAAKPDRRDASGKQNFKRQKKDTKFGFGGKKRHAKSNDAFSSADMRGSSTKGKKGKPGGGAAKQRPGKNRRARKA